MSDIASALQNLRTKVEQLIAANQGYENQIGELKATNKDLKQQLSGTQTRIEELTERNKIIKLAKSLDETDEGSSDIKLKINEIVREVDKCIAMLNK